MANWFQLALQTGSIATRKIFQKSPCIFHGLPLRCPAFPAHAKLCSHYCITLELCLLLDGEYLWMGERYARCGAVSVLNRRGSERVTVTVYLHQICKLRKAMVWRVGSGRLFISIKRSPLSISMSGNCCCCWCWTFKDITNSALPHLNLTFNVLQEVPLCKPMRHRSFCG